MKLKVMRRYVGHHGPFTHEIYLTNQAGAIVRFDWVGSVWSDRQWVNDTPNTPRFSRGVPVYRVGRQLWRESAGGKVAVPLTLADGEYFRPTQWNRGAAFVQTHPYAKAVAQ